MNATLWMSIAALSVGLAGCSAHPSYVVCRGEAYCTPPLNHEEAIQAAQVKKAWGDESLYIRPGR